VCRDVRYKDVDSLAENLLSKAQAMAEAAELLGTPEMCDRMLLDSLNLFEVVLDTD
jgi:hypothetical protein